MTEIVIQVCPGTDEAQATDLIQDTFGLQLQPLFPGSTDTSMQSWFHVALPTDVDADQVVSELAGHPAVESAYVKPPESAP
jgi:hypothetical protein